MAEPYVGWTCGNCGKPIAGRFSTCECGFGPEAHLATPPMAEPQPSELDRLHIAEIMACRGLPLHVYHAICQQGALALGAARAEGRREAIKECARLMAELAREAKEDRSVWAFERAEAAIRALLTEPGK